MDNLLAFDMTSHLISKLRESVESAQHADDLAPFLKHIPLQTLKAVINSHLSSINHNDTTLIHKLYHSCISIEDMAINVMTATGLGHDSMVDHVSWRHFSTRFQRDFAAFALLNNMIDHGVVT